MTDLHYFDRDILETSRTCRKSAAGNGETRIIANDKAEGECMKPRIAAIGAGVYGTHVLNVLASAARTGDVDLAAIADINPAALEQAAKRFSARGYLDYRKMFDQEDLDAVAIVTPDHLHQEIALDAAASGLHILCQKPIATRSEEGLEMIAAARQNNIMLYVDFHKRFDPAHQMLKRDLEQGKLGQVLYGDVYMEDRIEVPSVWFKRWADQSSPAWFLGTHFYDLVYWLLNSRPIQVFAHGRKVKLQAMGLDTYDSLSAQVIYENGAAVSFHTSWVLPENFPSIVNQQIRLVGTEGICEIDSQDRGMSASYAADPHFRVINPFSKFDTESARFDAPVSGYTCDSILHFIRLLRHLKNGTPLTELKGHYPSGEEAIVATITCEAIHQSAAQNIVINLS